MESYIAGLPHKLPAANAITSFHQLTPSTNRLQLQVDRGGVRRVVVFADFAALARCRQIRP